MKGSERTNHVAAAEVALEQAARTSRSECELTEQDGLPIVWAECAGPFTAGLVFRVGRADERTTHSGITHLVEHLALPNDAPPGLDYNGFVSGALTSFWARGDRDDALALLRDAAAALSDLPGRLETERRILLTEAERRGFGIVDAAAAARFGPRGHGLAGYPEFGLRWLDLEQISAWAAERFNRANAVLWMTGEPPPELDLSLPLGRRVAAPEPCQIPDVPFPAINSFGSPGGVGLSLLARRTTEGSMAAAIAVERARQRIRHEEGLSYLVDFAWEPLTADLAHVVFVCDCQAGDERATGRVLRDVLEQLESTGPAEDELRREVETRRRRHADPAGANQMLFYRAANELLGSVPTSGGELLDEVEQATPVGVRRALQEAMRSALLLTRDDAPAPGDRWNVYPAFSPSELRGRTFFPARAPLQRLRRSKVRLQAGRDGLTLVTAQGGFVTVPFEECAVAERWPGGTYVLLATDSSRLVVRSSEWRRGIELKRLIEEHLADERVVPMNRPVEERTKALARERESLRRDLEGASEHLDFGELPLTAVRATYGDCAGTLLLTPERVVFAFCGEPRLSLPLHDLVSIRLAPNRWSGYTALVVESREETRRFTSLPQAHAAELVDALAREAEHVVVHDSPSSWSGLATVGAYAAFPLSWLALAPLAALEDLTSRLRIVLLSVAVAAVCGGICAAGFWLGRIGRRRARTHGRRGSWATIGMGVSLLGALLWLALAVAVVVTEW